MTEPRPGYIGFSKITGFGGFFVKVAQWVIGDFSPYTHVYLVLDNDEVAEAMPGGVQINPLGKYSERDVIYYNFDLTDYQREKIVELARDLEGTPYSYLQYLYIALSHFKRCPQWIVDKVTSDGHMICSGMVDYCYKVAAFEDLFPDLPSQAITPGDLYRLIAKGATTATP